MMNPAHVREWIRTWETLATEFAQKGDRPQWLSCCIKIWTAEFILGGTDKAHPLDRIPFPD